MSDVLLETTRGGLLSLDDLLKLVAEDYARRGLELPEELPSKITDYLVVEKLLLPSRARQWHRSRCWVGRY